MSFLVDYESVLEPLLPASEISIVSPDLSCSKSGCERYALISSPDDVTTTLFLVSFDLVTSMTGGIPSPSVCGPGKSWAIPTQLSYLAHEPNANSFYRTSFLDRSLCSGDGYPPEALALAMVVNPSGATSCRASGFS